MDKLEFYTEQALKFRDYAGRLPNRKVLPLFEQWADSKDFTDEDRRGILTLQNFRELTPQEELNE